MAPFTQCQFISSTSKKLSNGSWFFHGLSVKNRSIAGNMLRFFQQLYVVFVKR